MFVPKLLWKEKIHQRADPKNDLHGTHCQAERSQSPREIFFYHQRKFKAARTKTNKCF